MGLKFRLKSCKTLCFLRDSGSGLQAVGPKTERFFTKGLKGEARNCQQLAVKRAQRPRETVWMKKVRNIRWHTVLIDTLKTSNFVLNPSSAVALACLDLRRTSRAI